MKKLLEKIESLYPDVNLLHLTFVGTNYRNVTVFIHKPFGILDWGKDLKGALEYEAREIQLQDVEIDGIETKLAVVPDCNLVFVEKSYLDKLE